MESQAKLLYRRHLGYLMQHLNDAPGYIVWRETHSDTYEENLAFLKAAEDLELSPQEMWLATLAVKIQSEVLSPELDFVTRVEVIDENGRAYTTNKCYRVTTNLQDNNRTLKIFLTNGTDDSKTLKSE